MKKKGYSLQIKFLMISFLVVGFLEIALRISGKFQTYNEQMLGTYFYKYRTKKDSWFHSWPKNTTMDYGYGEFTYKNTFNELGHRETSFTTFKNDTVGKKIICLGDSFTEGDGAPYDSSWVKLLENKLNNQTDIQYNLYNAGVCGSDVMFNYTMLKENLIDAKPNMVIECINHSDFEDIYYRGNESRFLPNGTTAAPNEKKWEVAFKYSHLFRAIVTTFTPYNLYLINESEWESEQKKIQLDMVNQLNRTASLCASHGIDYCVVIMPFPTDIGYDNYPLFKEIPSCLSGNIEVVDIHNCMNQAFDTLELTQFYWPFNGHFNGGGYDIMSSCIYKSLIQNKTMTTGGITLK